MKYIFPFLLLFCINAFAQNDVILLKSGQSIKCEIISNNDSTLRIDMNGAIIDYSKKGVDFYKMDYTWYNADGSVNNSLSKITYNTGHAPEKTIKLQDQVDYMRKNLRQSHYFFTTGLILDIVGGGISMISISSNNNAALIYGMVVSSVGTIFMITSHHFIGRAGIGLGGKGVTVRYTL